MTFMPCLIKLALRPTTRFPCLKELAPRSTEFAPCPTELAPRPTELAPCPTELAPRPTELAPRPTELAPCLTELAPHAGKPAPKPEILAWWSVVGSRYSVANSDINQSPDDLQRKNRKSKSIIGQMGGGKQALNGIIDIAVMQSLNRMGEVKDCVIDYGMVIVDECHHVSAFSFEMILKNVNAKYVYGLTATPARKDGHHPIIFMQCGPIRYRDDAKMQAEKRPFDHFIVPRFTSFNTPLDKKEKDIPIHELYAGIIENEMRNQLIIDDVVQCHKNDRNCLILTERTAHVELLAMNSAKGSRM
jgi:hypothetical protein